MSSLELASTSTTESATVKIPRLGIGLALLWLGVLSCGALGASFGLGIDPIANDYSAISQSPSWAHLFGTDNLGRDVLSRCLHGAGASAIVALTTVVIGGGLGIMLGVIAGLGRGIADSFIGLITDTVIALPAMMIIATIVALIGPSLMTIAFTIGFFAIPIFARLSRAATLRVATENHVLAARCLGASKTRILTKEVLPCVLPVMLPYVMTTLGSAIVSEGALSFLGFGLRPPQPSWGSLIAAGRTQLAQSPWVTLFPALLLCLTILAINVLGEYFREIKR